MIVKPAINIDFRWEHLKQWKEYYFDNNMEKEVKDFEANVIKENWFIKKVFDYVIDKVEVKEEVKPLAHKRK